MKKIYYLVFFLVLIMEPVCGQETLLSVEEQYYDFLALQGITERQYLNYRTLSDSVWTTPDESHPWQNINLGARYEPFHNIFIRAYGPELFTSFNNNSPYGQNDGALWQGKGFNSSLTGGARIAAYGVELTVRPQIVFSQNLDFDLVPSAYSTGEAAIYGYYGVTSIDAPQRFGDTPFFDYSWGDSEVRYTWKTLTVGFGTQSIWLGPAKINPILLSNNAPPYPKLDVGLRRQPVKIKNIYLGDIETRAFWGRLSESDYFDTNDENNHNLLTGFTFSYSFPYLLQGFSIGLNRVMLSKWNDNDYQSFFMLLWPFMENSNTGGDNRDQRLTFSFSYLLPVAGLEFYLEWGRNDFPSNKNIVVRDLFDTEAYTFGIVKNLLFTTSLQGKILIEITRLDSHRVTAQTFYAHHVITQGHTNQGQWLGAGLGTGGNSQYLGFTLFYNRGSSELFFQRQAINADYARYTPGKEQKALMIIGANNFFNLFN
ncbi:MAG: capsule assembly Wzi family protein, partial [Bacteroidales bacterium]|nr:capsule assembly Wzi family protein [Bacteroidales bacterium]